VAIRRYFLDHQAVARRLALEPQLVAGAAEEGGVSGLDGLAKRLLVHEADHQDALRGVVLNNRRDQAVHFLEIQIHTHKKARREFNRLRASFLKFALESLEVRPPIEKMALVMMLPGDGHDYHRKIHLSRQMRLRVLPGGLGKM